MGTLISDLPAPTVATGNTFESDLSLSALPPGDYLLEFVATAGTDSVKKLVAIKIAG
jgi:hypothetical protein